MNTEGVSVLVDSEKVRGVGGDRGVCFCLFVNLLVRFCFFCFLLVNLLVSFFLL